MVTTLPSSAAIYRGLVTHTRRTPFRYRLRHKTFMWLVDVDELPRPAWPLGALARFAAADHLGDPNASIRSNVEDFLRDEGATAPVGRVLMLCHARSFGYVFNPLTVYWCYDRQDRLAHVIAEVHNTYRGRHRYLLHTDSTGRAETPKEFYVSPFNPVRGRYRLRLAEPGPELRLGIVYELDGEVTFAAAMTARRHAATPGTLLRACARHPFSTLAVSAAIRWHGVKLFLKGLPVQPRQPAVVTPSISGRRGDHVD